jgi:hypothetical protein
MDFNNLKKSVANLSLYDIKAGVRQLQNGTKTELLEERSQVADTIVSCHELYGNGSQSPRGHKQRTVSEVETNRDVKY